MFEVDFLPVGDSNGDAICVRYGSPEAGYSIHVIDGGYTTTAKAIIRHIEKHYGKHSVIDHMVLTHADNDHACGLIGVIEHFKVKNLWMNRPWLYVDEVINSFHGNFTEEGLIEAIKEKHAYLVRLEELAGIQGTMIHEVFQGARIGAFTILAPSRERYVRLIPDLDKTPTKYALESASEDAIAEALEAMALWLEETWNIETLSNNPERVSASNETSVVQMGVIDNRKILLTGDAGPEALHEAADYAEAIDLLPDYPKFVQVPHHGSRKNVTPALLDRWLGPEVSQGQVYGTAYCSVGAKKDNYPRGQVQNAFERRGYPVHATRGKTKCQRYGCKARPGWVASSPEPWAKEVKF